MMMMEDTRRQVAMGDMVHDMLIARPPSPARMEYRLVTLIPSVRLRLTLMFAGRTNTPAPP